MEDAGLGNVGFALLIGAVSLTVYGVAYLYGLAELKKPAPRVAKVTALDNIYESLGAPKPKRSHKKKVRP